MGMVSQLGKPQVLGERCALQSTPCIARPPPPPLPPPLPPPPPPLVCSSARSPAHALAQLVAAACPRHAPLCRRAPAGW